MHTAPFALERYFAAHEFSARRLLSCSDCEPLSLKELLADADAELLSLWNSLRLGYTESRGLPLLRREIAMLYPGMGAEHIVEVVPEEGILLGMQALLHPGDSIVVTMPAYQSLHEIARAAGCKIREWWPEENQDWRFDPAALAKIAEGARLIVINFPHNPTGWLPSVEEFRQIFDIAESTGAWVFSDEMYRLLEHDPQTTLPSAVELYPRALALGGLSKGFGLPGLRAGWLASQDIFVLDRILEAKDYTTICGSAPGEILALIALRSRKKILARNRALICRNLDYFEDWLGKNPAIFRWTRPRASSVGLAEILAAESATAFCERLVRESGIAMVPSGLFGDNDRHTRIGFGRADFQTGLDELEVWAKQHLHRR
jgi:aspartate/methionine/tyrosine aminotransferase